MEERFTYIAKKSRPEVEKLDCGHIPRQFNLSVFIPKQPFIDLFSSLLEDLSNKKSSKIGLCTWIDEKNDLSIKYQKVYLALMWSAKDAKWNGFDHPFLHPILEPFFNDWWLMNVYNLWMITAEGDALTALDAVDLKQRISDKEELGTAIINSSFNPFEQSINPKKNNEIRSWNDKKMDFNEWERWSLGSGGYNNCLLFEFSRCDIL